MDRIVGGRHRENRADGSDEGGSGEVEVDAPEKQPLLDALPELSFQPVAALAVPFVLDPVVNRRVEALQIVHEVEVGRHHRLPIVEQQDELLDHVAGIGQPALVNSGLTAVEMPHTRDNQRFTVAEEFVDRSLGNA